MAPFQSILLYPPLTFQRFLGDVNILQHLCKYHGRFLRHFQTHSLWSNRLVNAQPSELAAMTAMHQVRQGYNLAAHL